MSSDIGESSRHLNPNCLVRTRALFKLERTPANSQPAANLFGRSETSAAAVSRRVTGDCPTGIF